MILQKMVEDLKHEKAFKYFTKLLKKKIYDAPVSDELSEEVKKHLSGIIEELIIFECPNCKIDIIIEKGISIYECECGRIINLKNIEYEKRYSINQSFYNNLINFFQQIFSFNEYKLKYIFGGKKKMYLIHDSILYIHITPFDIWTNDRKILDDAYMDNFALGWKYFLDFFDVGKRNKIFKQLVDLREEEFEKIIKWEKIDEWDFQNMCREILEKEKRYDKIIPGGTGPDQGKDMFGFGNVILLSNKIMPIKSLIQCKYTKIGKTFSFEKISQYINRAKQHDCSTLLFMTNGNLSGDCITAIESQFYKTKDFIDVDFYNREQLTQLIKKNDEIRIKYFFKNSEN